MRKQNVIYYELKPALLVLGALYILFAKNGVFFETPLALFSLSIAAVIIYRRLQYRGYLNFLN